MNNLSLQECKKTEACVSLHDNLWCKLQEIISLGANEQHRLYVHGNELMEIKMFTSHWL